MDYNVAAVALSVPPVPAYLTTYRPAVSVRNEGIHDADVTGTLRIYDRTTGLMIWSAPLAAAGVPPGETRDAIASLYWTPDHIGDYIVQGFVTTDRDQDPDDNQLASVTVPVSAEPPPPPPTVPIHATQHEAAGTDPLNVAGLHGRLADTQSPTSHASSHGPAGSDVLSVEGLHGRLADAQAVENHGNDQHTPAMATASALSDHDQDTAAHVLSSNLEHVSRRGVANGYPSLDAQALVPVAQLGIGASGGPGATLFLREDSSWQTVQAALLSVSSDVDLNFGGLSIYVPLLELALDGDSNIAPGQFYRGEVSGFVVLAAADTLDLALGIFTDELAQIYPLAAVHLPRDPATPTPDNFWSAFNLMTVERAGALIVKAGAVGHIESADGTARTYLHTSEISLGWIPQTGVKLYLLGAHTGPGPTVAYTSALDLFRVT
jgi:hypothetical protein